MPHPITLAILDHPKLRGPAISIRHDPAFGIAPEVVRGQGWNLADLCFLLHHSPDNLGAETGTPDPSGLIDGAKESSSGDSRSPHPAVDSSFHPIRDRNGSDVSALADKIGNDPVLFPLLEVLNA